MTDSRPNWDEYWAGMSSAAGARAECKRRKVGAIVVVNNEIVASGYNGALPGAPSCLDGACPRGMLDRTQAPSGSDYYNCIADHAERNALRYAMRHHADLRKEFVVYSSHKPCPACTTLLQSMEVKRVVYTDEEGVIHDYDIKNR